MVKTQDDGVLRRRQREADHIGRFLRKLRIGFMKQMLVRLSADWQERWHHPLASHIEFSDPKRVVMKGHFGAFTGEVEVAKKLVTMLSFYVEILNAVVALSEGHSVEVIRLP